MDEIVPAFRNFVEFAEDVAVGELGLEGRTVQTEPLLNGTPYRAHRLAFGIEHRRSAGTFFTGADSARIIAQQLHRAIPADGMVMDPTCGIGDLLLAYAEKLPIGKSLSQTLELWGRKLAGLDLDRDLIRLAKARLVIQARLRGDFKDDIDCIESIFPLIRVGDMFSTSSELSQPDGFLFNPPFGVIKDVSGCDWSAGSVNSAALFLVELIERKKDSAAISALLPEVLRCGSRYAAFRNYLRGMGVGGNYTSLGRFDTWADVDVFSTLIAASQQEKIWDADVETVDQNSVGDRFDVRVGTVVPHRHKNRGPWRRYICAKSTPRWNVNFEPTTSRRFSGTTFMPPFVVVRRTSSPSDRYRAVATVVVGDRPVAVENHLLVLLPHDKKLKGCVELSRVLALDETNDYLNTAMRCRHLTTGIVGQIPWIPSDG